jgi:CRISPR-associated protein Csm4
MTPLIVTLRPLTAFATPLMGDTLFGQLCWAIRHGFGEARLDDLLAGYTAGRPFLVVSDALPAGYLPLPHLPAHAWAGASDDPKERKTLKKIAWVPLDAIGQPLADWQRLSRERQPQTPPRPDERKARSWFLSSPQPRNSLNRLTLCTGEGEGFSPYTVRQFWYDESVRLDVHFRLDEERLSRTELKQTLTAVGLAGFGKDANVGLGKFALDGMKDSPLKGQDGADAWLALAPCAPQGCGFDAQRSYYKPFTRYGRHGDFAARLGNVFKQPVLLAAAGAVFGARASEDCSHGFIGQGLGGDGALSSVMPATVHQGYAPALPIRLPEGLA